MHTQFSLERERESFSPTMASSTMLAWAGCALLFFLAYLAFLLRRKKRSGINWPIVGMLPSLVRHADRLHAVCTESMAASRLSTVRFKGPWFLGLDFIFTCNPDNLNHIYSTNCSNYHKGNAFLEIFDILGEGIIRANAESWRLQRRLGHNNMSSQRSFMVESTCRKMSDSLLPLLNEIACCTGAAAVDLQEVMLRFTFDITCINVFGVDLRYLASDFPRMSFPEAMHEMERVLLFRHTVPRAWWKLLRALNIGEERKMSEALSIADSFIARVIYDKRDDDAKNVNNNNRNNDRDLLTLYMSQIAEMDVSMFRSRDKFLRDTMLTLMGAGTSTTGVALAWFFYSMSMNPRVEEKLVEELHHHACSCMDDKKLVSVTNGFTTFTLEGLDELVYLHASIFESLRLFTPVPFNHREAVSHDTLPTGHRVDPGCTILIPIYSMGRMKKVWGEDCLEFKPERWITEQGKLRHEPSYKFSTFASGPRTCLGKNTAMVQMKIVVAAVMYNFEIRAVERRVVQPALSIVLEMKDGLLVNLLRRKSGGVLD